ncbi:MAG: hypothetical protein R3277_13020 [Brumimicrobium sp.]|nr:hypothetical protein [Brumimicrobium sp.]
MNHIRIALCFCIFFSLAGRSQNYDYEIGVEVQAASFSNLGGTVGGSVKFAIVEEETVAFGPSLRYQYLWNKNTVTGVQGNASTFGAGGFLHYRFMDWFFLGTDIEVLQNPFNYVQPDKKWTLTAFLGGGISRDVDFVRLNLGLFYDVVDGLKDPLTTNPSPLRRNYFIQRQSPSQPGQGAYLPIIYRITFFFPLGD